MKKLAIFVEGKTERVFVEKLIRLMIDVKKLNIAVFQAMGGSPCLPRRIVLIYKTPDDVVQEFYVQIVESCNDERVASDVRDSYDGLMRAGFSAVVGIRDVYPRATLDKLPELRRALRYRIKTKPVDPVLVLGVMEVEAWFLSEYHHFPHIHPQIDCPRISATFHFDPSTDDMQLRLCPADDLHAIYQLEGLAYRKTSNHIQRTVDVLDYGYIYYDMVERFEDLKTLVDTLGQFFTVPA